MARTWLVLSCPALSVGGVNKTVQTIKFVLPGHILFTTHPIFFSDSRLWPSRAGNGCPFFVLLRPGQEIALIVVAGPPAIGFSSRRRYKLNLQPNSIFVCGLLIKIRFGTSFRWQMMPVFDHYFPCGLKTD